MLFRNKDGNIVNINRLDYTNDSIYYTKVMNVKHSHNVNNTNINKIIESTRIIQKTLKNM